MPKGQSGTGKPFLRGRIWYVTYYVDGIQKQESTGSTDLQYAVKFLNKRRAEADAGDLCPENPTTGQLLQLVKADYSLNERRTNTLDGLIRLHLKALSKIRASALSTTDLNRYKTKRLAEGAAPSSINRELEVVRRGFQLGFDHKPKLVAGIPKIEKLEEDNVREGFLEHEDYLRLRSFLPHHQQLLLVMGYSWGMRRGELLKLRWNQVDFRAGVVKLERWQTKTKKAREAPLFKEVRMWLEMAPRDAETIISYAGQSITEIKRAWNTARLAAALPKLLFHDLRRTAVRNMVRAGIPEKVASEISGHKTRSMFDRYNITDHRDIVNAGKALESYFGEIEADCNYSAITSAKLQ
jgi:integrase